MPWMAAPAALVRLPPLIVEPLMTTEEEASALEIVPPALFTGVLEICRTCTPLEALIVPLLVNVPWTSLPERSMISVPPPVACIVP